jgi:sec-independent protein translocase protein TatA
MPGIQEWLVILVIALFVFGPDRLPQAGRTLGQTVRRVREGVNGSQELRELRDEVRRLKTDLTGAPQLPQRPKDAPKRPVDLTDEEAT